jgi:hypothetical protein
MRQLGWALIAAWAILSVASIAQFAAEGPGGRTSEIEARLAYELLILNFPISTGVVFIAPRHPILQWCLFTAMGFVQWTFFVPLLIRWCRRLCARARHNDFNRVAK